MREGEPTPATSQPASLWGLHSLTHSFMALSPFLTPPRPLCFTLSSCVRASATHTHTACEAFNVDVHVLIINVQVGSLLAFVLLSSGSRYEVCIFHIVFSFRGVSCEQNQIIVDLDWISGAWKPVGSGRAVF